MPKLYELAEEYRLLSEQLEDMENLDQQTVIDTLEGSTQLMDIEEKTAAIIRMVKNWESEIPAYEEEIKRLTESKKAIDNRVKSVKAYLKGCLETAGLARVKIGVFTARLQNNSRGSVIVDDPSIVPAKYIDIIPQQEIPNNDRLYQDLKIGLKVPGVRYEVGKHLRIG